jgi:hypothetical protein
MDLDEFHVLEWSESQKQFHNSTLAQSVEAGRKLFFKKASPDWVVVGIFRTLEERETVQSAICIKRGLEWSEPDLGYIDTKVQKN